MSEEKSKRTKGTIRTIDGIRYCCYDIGCLDFERAAYNRLIIANKWFTTFYRAVESWLVSTPLNHVLPKWMPTGVLPRASGKTEFWEQAEREHDEAVVEFIDIKEQSKEISDDGKTILDELD